jgi:hypothetical protein
VKTPHEIGREWELLLEQKLGGRQVIQSGALWFAKLDVRDRKLLWSAKSTTKERFSLSVDLVDEMVRATRGPGGDGEAIPGMAIRLEADGRDVQGVFLLLDDFIALLTGEPIYAPNPKNIRRQIARTPSLLRGTLLDADASGAERARRTL